MKLQWKRDTCKKCTLYKYLPYTVQCRSYSKKTVNQLYIYSTVLGAAIECKQYSEITVEGATHEKCKNRLAKTLPRFRKNQKLSHLSRDVLIVIYKSLDQLTGTIYNFLSISKYIIKIPN